MRVLGSLALMLAATVALVGVIAVCARAAYWPLSWQGVVLAVATLPLIGFALRSR